MNICFLMYPWEEIKPDNDSSLTLIHECAKTIPGEKDYRLNVTAVGRVEKHRLTQAEKILCKKIGPKLVEEGLYFIGIDMVNGKLVEVNVMSPSGIAYFNGVSKIKLQEKVVDFLENKILEKNIAFRRMTDLKKQVNEA